MADDTHSRFATVSEDDMQCLLDSRLSGNTKRVIGCSIRTLSEYSKKRNMSLNDLYQLPKAELNDFLRQFYAEARKHDGSLYTRNGLISLRYGLHKHFSKMCDCDIVSDREFSSSSELFSSVLVSMKKQGKGDTQHKQPLSSDDFNKLYTSNVLSTSDPVGLQNKVFVDIMMYSCNPGGVNLRDMKKSDFQILTDSAGLRYVSVVDKQTKNHQGQNDDLGQQDRMYQLPGNPKCPVLSFEKYISKLNSEMDCFWQKPATKTATEETECWYEKFPVGVNTLVRKMKTLSVEANLSAIYTNHCLRATCITARRKWF